MSAENINPQEYYNKRLGITGLGKKHEHLVSCVFHQDKTPSLSVNTESGVWFCHAGCGGGNVVQFESKLKGISTKAAYAELKREFSTVGSSHKNETDKPPIEQDKFIDEKVVMGYHDDLLKCLPIISDFLLAQRGITSDTIEKYKIGYDVDTQRITIPVYHGDKCVNIRKYLPKAQAMKVLNTKGFGGKNLFPESSLSSDLVYIMEGEMDCLLALSLGLTAVTSTGAGHWDESWNELFKDKQVVIVYDIDDAGREGSKKIVEHLKTVAKMVKNIKLPIADPPNGDFTDYIMTHGFNVNDFIHLVNETPIVQDEVAEVRGIKTNLADCANSIYHKKFLELSITVCGKDDESYNVTKNFVAKCSPKKECFNCQMYDKPNNEMVMEIPGNSDMLLKMIDVSNDQLKGHLRSFINPMCKRIHITELDKQSVETAVAMPEVTYNSDVKSEYITRQVFSSGHALLKPNRSYNVKGYNYTNPKNQQSAFLITEAVATQSILDASRITPDIKKSLKIFQCAPTVDDIEKKLVDIYDDFAFNITKIYKREDLLLACDLSYHSVLTFDFLNRTVYKGWTDILILGDTKCGKSATIEALIKHYKAGEIIGGDNISFAGLVGGLQQFGRGWNVTWGKLPLNNGGLVAIDELSSMSLEDLSFMTGIRTSGVAEITKIKPAKSQARTRFLAFSNPRSGRKMNTYSKGILAVKELIGRSEDISRFDLAIALSDGEVDQAEINKMLYHEVEHKYTSKLSHDLVVWAWTRKKDDVVFSKEAESKILELSLLLNAKYDSSIPLVTPAEQRIKLARLSVALATRLFSTDESCDKVLVEVGHVEYVYKFIDQCYSKPIMAYDLHSEIANKSFKFITDNYEKLKNEFKSLQSGFLFDWGKLKSLLLEYEIIKKGELELQLQWDDATTKEFFGWAYKNRLIHSIHNGYVKHPLFIKMLKDLNKEETEGGVKDSTTEEVNEVVDKAKEIFGVV